MFCCGFACSKRKVYIPYITNRIPKEILCRQCHKKSRAILVVDSYSFEVCMCSFILYTSHYYLICVLCEGRINSFNDLQCSECNNDTNSKYCQGCGVMKQFLSTKTMID